jgi:hypothetical protein
VRPDTPTRTLIAIVLTASVCLSSGPALGAEGDGWIPLFGTEGSSLDAWRTPAGDWRAAAEVGLDPANPRKLVAARQGRGIIWNGPTGKTLNLVSREKFGDVDVRLEFLIPKGSNSGIKLQEVYEVQIFESKGAKPLTASHNGGIYPRAELLPKYHHIDKGYPPKVDASKAAGEWQTLEIRWLAPKFDDKGKKVANGKFVKVVLNGLVVQEDLELPSPTGNNWRNPEHPSGSIFLQGDHGPVAFRNLFVRPIPANAKP